MNDLAAMISKLPENEQQKLFSQMGAYKEAIEREKAQADFMSFVKMMWPSFIHGRHHALMAKKFEEIASGKLKRLIINMAPRHTKSEFGSYLLPAWFLGKYPDKKVIQCSNTAELAVGFGRKVRNLVGSDHYKTVFPNVDLRADSKAAGRWDTSGGGSYFAIGVGGTVTGKGADLLIIDDPHSEQEARLAQGDPTVFDGVYEWYTSGPRQRLQPGAAIVLIMCMTGDTPVLMENGTEKPLRDVCIGDVVATYDNGKVAKAKVLNWRSNGYDSVFKVRLGSGKIVRANERHPFLVDDNGQLRWIRLKNLKIGQTVVKIEKANGTESCANTMDAASQYMQDISVGCTTTTKYAVGKDGKEKTTDGENIEGLRVIPKDVTSPRFAKTCAKPIITRLDGLQGISAGRLKVTAMCVYIRAMGLLNKITNCLLKNKTANVQSASSHQQIRIPERIGTASCVSIMTTKQGMSEDCCVMTATCPLDTEKPRKTCCEPLSTFAVSSDFIVDISPDGIEEVFDVQIDRTENFIANGVVSHNTRWSDKDLTGKILRSSRNEDEWEVIELPAILPSGVPLWPEFWNLEELTALREELPPYKWNAQYQQTPTGEAGAIVKREWWKRWDRDRPPACEFIIQSWDTAFTKNERSDYSACTTWGVFNLNDDPNDVNIMLLDAFKDKWEFPELKQQAFASWKEWQPDAFVVEAKAAGAPLIFELRRMGIPVSEYTPSRGNDKFVRLNSITDLLASGKVWAPDTRWADEVIEEMARFPNAEHDDLLDSAVQALIRFRQGGFLRLESDEQDDPVFYRQKKAYY